MLALILGSLSLAVFALGSGVSPGQITDLVTFGDAYTDLVIKGAGPDSTAWPVYVAGRTGVKLHPFAIAAATCSVNITFPTPSVFEDELPSYFREKSNGTLQINPANTVYTLWIGANDVGSHSLLTGQSKATIVDVTDCSVNWVTTLYNSGARNFIFQNILPLELSPLYYGNIFMKELVVSGNEIAKLKLKKLAFCLEDAHIALFDSYSLFVDMFTQPKLYLNGTIAPNVRGSIHTDGAKGTARDSYLWYQTGHPSEQALRIVAREMGALIAGNHSQWGTWLS